jgi:hypothetical protein
MLTDLHVVALRLLHQVSLDQLLDGGWVATNLITRESNTLPRPLHWELEVGAEGMFTLLGVDEAIGKIRMLSREQVFDRLAFEDGIWQSLLARSKVTHYVSECSDMYVRPTVFSCIMQYFVPNTTWFINTNFHTHIFQGVIRQLLLSHRHGMSFSER